MNHSCKIERGTCGISITTTWWMQCLPCSLWPRARDGPREYSIAYSHHSVFGVCLQTYSAYCINKKLIEDRQTSYSLHTCLSTYSGLLSKCTKNVNRYTIFTSFLVINHWQIRLTNIKNKSTVSISHRTKPIRSIRMFNVDRLWSLKLWNPAERILLLIQMSEMIMSIQCTLSAGQTKGYEFLLHFLFLFKL